MSDIKATGIHNICIYNANRLNIKPAIIINHYRYHRKHKHKHSNVRRTIESISSLFSSSLDGWMQPQTICDAR